MKKSGDKGFPDTKIDSTPSADNGAIPRPKCDLQRVAGGLRPGHCMLDGCEIGSRTELTVLSWPLNLRITLPVAVSNKKMFLSPPPVASLPMIGQISMFFTQSRLLEVRLKCVLAIVTADRHIPHIITMAWRK